MVAPGSTSVKLAPDREMVRLFTSPGAALYQTRLIRVLAVDAKASVESKENRQTAAIAKGRSRMPPVEPRGAGDTPHRPKWGSLRLGRGLFRFTPSHCAWTGGAAGSRCQNASRSMRSRSTS